ncbi:MAG TPA: maleylpyruvate isomerase N-terminal domain-containing protein [Acidimicrobiales bacterium]|nr:maleylpyruvate isomerase N-terminal domain-containing protein [Acidimicrobiales bacterium]
MPLTVAVGDARDAFEASVIAFSGAVTSLEEWDLLASSRCHGWSRLEVATHLVAGWQEMLAGFVTLVDDDPTVDAASYWRAFGDMTSACDPVDVLMAQRRRAAAYARPSAVLAQLGDVADAVLSGGRAMGGRPCRWQGQVFAPGDFLAIWAVENVVHHLDLLVEGRPPSSGLTLARATVEALAEEPLPGEWTDEQAVLIGTGRLPVPAEAATLSSRFPVLH